MPSPSSNNRLVGCDLAHARPAKSNMSTRIKIASTRSSRKKPELVPKPAGRHHHGDLKDALLTAATHLMVERGRPDFTLRELAKMLGVGHTATYKHFADKDSLLTELALHGFGLLGQRQQRLRSSASDDPWRVLVSTGEAYVSFALDYPAHFQVMFDPRLSEVWRLNEDVRAAQGKALAAFRSAIESCQAEGLLPRDAMVERILIVLWSCGHGLAQLLGGGLLDSLSLRGTSQRQAIELISNVVPRCIQDQRSQQWLSR